MDDWKGSTRAQWAARLVRQKLAEEIPKVKELIAQEERRRQNSPGFAAMELSVVPPLFDGLLGTAPLEPLHLPQDGALYQRLHRPEHLDTPDSHLVGGGGGTVHHVPSGIGAGPGSGDKHRICIVGAGVAGLFIAMILDSLDITDLEYDLLEASDRAGGRMLTHYFSKDTLHDYYDIGAMRFPDIDIMKNTFKLFKDHLNIPLIPYYLDAQKEGSPVKGSVNCPTMYNDRTVVSGDHMPLADPFHVSVSKGGSVPNGTVDRVGKLLDDAFRPFKEALAKDFEPGFKILLEYDNYSTREFLKNPPPMPDVFKRPERCQWEKLDFFTIQWLETNNTSSGLFDQGFTESVMDSFDFDAPKKKKEDDAKTTNHDPKDGEPEKWFCINGGTSLVTQAMEKKIKRPIQRNMRVNKLFQDKTTKMIEVSVVGEQSGTREPYTTVFNTTSLACLQRIDLTGLNLHPTQKDAIRTLHYDDSAKVAIKFSYPWWITKCGISSGGTAASDLPIRTCVYPSYNIDDPKDKPAVLLCSYTWAQDATRIGSLIKNNTNSKRDPDQAELRDLMLDNLARLHLKNFQLQEPDMQLKDARKVIGDAYVEHHAFSWSHDPFTSGAFALFGPGQFANLYPYLSRPAADSRFHICGEASSAHHAWIVGALDSALASVHRFLRRFEMWEYIEKLDKTWGTPGEVEKDVTGTLHLQVELGMLPQRFMVTV